MLAARAAPAVATVFLRPCRAPATTFGLGPIEQIVRLVTAELAARLLVLLARKALLPKALAPREKALAKAATITVAKAARPMFPARGFPA
jgi:hypothetical protein